MPRVVRSKSRSCRGIRATVVSGTTFLRAASALLLCGPLCGFAWVQDWTLSYQAPVRPGKVLDMLRAVCFRQKSRSWSSSSTIRLYPHSRPSPLVKSFGRQLAYESPRGTNPRCVVGAFGDLRNRSAGGSSNCQAFLCLTDAPLPFVLRNGAANQLHFSPGDFGQSVLNGRAAVKDRCSGSGRHPLSQSTATPTASPFSRSAIDPTERTSCVVIPPVSGHSRCTGSLHRKPHLGAAVQSFSIRMSAW